MTALLGLTVFALCGICAMTLVAMLTASKRIERQQERMALRARLVAISRGRERWYDD